MHDAHPITALHTQSRCSIPAALHAGQGAAFCVVHCTCATRNTEQLLYVCVCDWFEESGLIEVKAAEAATGNRPVSMRVAAWWPAGGRPSLVQDDPRRAARWRAHVSPAAAGLASAPVPPANVIVVDSTLARVATEVHVRIQMEAFERALFEQVVAIVVGDDTETSLVAGTT